MAFHSLLKAADCQLSADRAVRRCDRGSGISTAASPTRTQARGQTTDREQFAIAEAMGFLDDQNVESRWSSVRRKAQQFGERHGQNAATGNQIARQSGPNLLQCVKPGLPGSEVMFYRGALGLPELLGTFEVFRRLRRQDSEALQFASQSARQQVSSLDLCLHLIEFKAATDDLGVGAVLPHLCMHGFHRRLAREQFGFAMFERKAFTFDVSACCRSSASVLELPCCRLCPQRSDHQCLRGRDAEILPLSLNTRRLAGELVQTCTGFVDLMR